MKTFLLSVPTKLSCYKDRIKTRNNKIIWKKLPIYPYGTSYLINNFGTVRSLNNYHHHNKYHSLKPTKNKKGYYYVSLSYKGCHKKYYIHRLVATTFIPNIYNYSEVNHKNEIKSDNNINNLEWCSHYYNLMYGTHNKRMANTLGKSILLYGHQGNFYFSTTLKAAIFIHKHFRPNSKISSIHSHLNIALSCPYANHTSRHYCYGFYVSRPS